MRYLIVGAGALGGYYGGRLLEAGCDVTFLVRPNRAKMLAQTGLRVRSRFGDIDLAAPACVLADALKPEYDVVVVASKAYDLEETMRSFAPAVGDSTAVLPLLNGLRHIEMLQARFGVNRVLGGVCLISATLDEDGTIRHLNDLHTLLFGELDGSASPRVQRIAADFLKPKFEGRLSPQIVQDLWEKWLFIAAAAGMTCLMRASIGDIVAASATELSLALVDECAVIAAAAGHAPAPVSLERARSALTAAGSPITASMLKDIERGGKIEADHIIGDLLARAPGGPASKPLLRVVHAHLMAYEARRARQGAGASAVARA
jgi:2-dehydropantoate 2-reductase